MEENGDNFKKLGIEVKVILVEAHMERNAWLKQFMAEKISTADLPCFLFLKLAPTHDPLGTNSIISKPATRRDWKGR